MKLSYISSSLQLLAAILQQQDVSNAAFFFSSTSMPRLVRASWILFVSSERLAALGDSLDLCHFVPCTPPIKLVSPKHRYSSQVIPPNCGCLSEASFPSFSMGVPMSHSEMPLDVVKVPLADPLLQIFHSTHGAIYFVVQNR